MRGEISPYQVIEKSSFPKKSLFPLHGCFKTHSVMINFKFKFFVLHRIT